MYMSCSMSDILETESNAVITAKKLLINWQNSMVLKFCQKCCRWCINLILANYASPTLTPSVQAPRAGGGSWQPADVWTPQPSRGGHLMLPIFASLILKCSGLSHPFIR